MSLRKTALAVAWILVALSPFAAAPAEDAQPEKKAITETAPADTSVSDALELMIDVEDNAKMLRMDVRDLKERIDKMIQIEDAATLKSEMAGVQRTLMMLERSSQALWQNCAELLEQMKAAAAAENQTESKPARQAEDR